MENPALPQPMIVFKLPTPPPEPDCILDPGGSLLVSLRQSRSGSRLSSCEKNGVFNQILATLLARWRTLRGFGELQGEYMVAIVGLAVPDGPTFELRVHPEESSTSSRTAN